MMRRILKYALRGIGTLFLLLILAGIGLHYMTDPCFLKFHKFDSAEWKKWNFKGDLDLLRQGPDTPRMCMFDSLKPILEKTKNLSELESLLGEPDSIRSDEIMYYLGVRGPNICYLAFNVNFQTKQVVKYHPFCT